MASDLAKSLPPLTIQQSQAVSYMVEALAYKAETGQAPTEHAMAMRLLSAGSTAHGPAPKPSLQAAEAPRSDSHAPSPAASMQFGGPKSAAAPGSDKFDQLAAMLMGTTQTPDQQVSSGFIPTVPVIGVPPNYGIEDAAENYALAQYAQSICQLYACMLAVAAGESYNITNSGEAQLAFAAQANYAMQAMQGPLAGFYTFSSGTTSQFQQTVNRSELHDKFLQEVFGPYGLDDNTTKSLDGILTNFTRSLSKVGLGNNARVDHCLRFSLTPRINITADESNPIYVFQPTTYLIYFRINGTSYNQAISKRNSVEKVNFSMEYSVVKCQLNARTFKAAQPKFDAIFNELTGQNLQAFSKKLVQEAK